MDERFFEIVEPIPSIERFRDRYAAREGAEGIVALLDLASGVAEGAQDVRAARGHARRTVELTPEQVDEVVELAREAGRESYAEQLALFEVLQAATVAACDLGRRNVVSMRLALAAKQAVRYERARTAYADAYEGLRILDRFFEVDEEAVAGAERSIRDGWDEVSGRTDPVFDVLEPAAADPTPEWMDVILWNLDPDSGGLLAQVDATMRLALRFEYWIARGRDPEPVADGMREACASMSVVDPFLAARSLVTLGDALMEAGRWALAARAYRDSRDHTDPRHPLPIHGLVQEAYCHLMLGDVAASRAALDTVDRAFLEQLSDLVITVAAELARYHAVNRLCALREGTAPPDERETVAALIKKVALIVGAGRGDRTRYLRNLFFGALVRDVGSILEAAG